MNFRFIKLPMISFCFILFSSLICISDASANPLKISYIHSGDAGFILIQTPNRKTMLIDSGYDKDAQTVIKTLTAHRIKQIDMLVATNANDDRIGAMDEVMNKFKIGHLYIPKVNFMSQALQDLLKMTEMTRLNNISRNEGGLSLKLDPALKIEMLTPNSETYENPSDYSAVLKLTYGKTSFLLIGDSSPVSFKEMMKKGFNLKANLFMTGRQEKNTILTDDFIAAVSPDYAVISTNKSTDDTGAATGKTILTRLRKTSVKIYQAGFNQTITAESNGAKITLTVR